MPSFILGAATAFLLAGAAGAAGGAIPGFASGPYTWDTSGVCHDANGVVVDESLCPAKLKPAAACHDRKSGKAESCQAKGAVKNQP